MPGKSKGAKKKKKRGKKRVNNKRNAGDGVILSLDDFAPIGKAIAKVQPTTYEQFHTLDTADSFFGKFLRKTHS